ncbi:Pentatricopeptide repeat-containing protein At3g04130, mitochondrial [Linum perenne]
MVFLKKLPRQSNLFISQLNSRALYAFKYGSLAQQVHSQFKLKPTGFDQQEEKNGSANPSDLSFLIAKVHDHGGSHNEILQSLMQDNECKNIQVSHDLVSKLLSRFKDDWKSALAVFKWAAESNPDYDHSPEACDAVVDILGKMKQMEQMNAFLDEMRRANLVTLKTMGKAMRRYAGARQWEDAVRLFDKLETFGLRKSTESMNLLLDTLCKERRVEQAREIFLELKSHISPDANTYNIFIHGWCKINRVDEAYWTLQEMKGCGVKPCVISYSTIVQFHCQQQKFGEVYGVLDEMEAQGFPPNVVTYTTILCHLTKSEDYEQALQIVERMKSVGCRPDTLFYNAFIHMLGRAGKVEDAVRVFEVEMPKIGVLPNTSTYNSMVAMFCHHGLPSRGLDLLMEMEDSMVCKPDVHTYYPLLKSCLRSGKVDVLLSQLLDDMVTKHHLSLDLSAYKLLIHGLCRANRCEWAYRLFEEMISKDIKPRYQTCNVLLEEVRLNGMLVAAEKIEAFMKQV